MVGNVDRDVNSLGIRLYANRKTETRMVVSERQRNNISSNIYELRPEPTTLGGAIGIPSNGTRLLHRLGVYDELLTRGSSCSNVVMHSERGTVLGETDVVGAAKEATGFGYMRIKRTDLLDVFLKEVDNAGIPVRYNKRLVSISNQDDGVKATFSDGTVDTADLLLGCDGIHSAVRRLYVDPTVRANYTGLAGIGSIIPVSVLGEEAAPQLRGMHITMMQEGMVSAMSCSANDDEIYWGFQRELALPNGENDRDGWEIRREQEVSGFRELLHGVLKGAGDQWGDMLRGLVDQTSVVKFYPIFKLPSGGTWHKKRVLLLGDAAHAMPPHAGQGVSMALEDAFLLSRLLGRKQAWRRGEDDVNEVYETYDRIRRPRIDELAARSSGNAALRKKTGRLGLMLKEFGIWMFLHGSWALGMDKWGSEMKQMVYDIEEVEI
ncbi:hypothetical protein PV08_04252 [Exophiala spinifera]|uniref:FAD-binding domain-containing protein n=1 Tax=Exophiala spinifera TaxID=91928 RepID=A0A0D1YPG3_9EURO|nr:uncharacterized protein PV08_04252 [Exophiala spinifera]KIW17061.1 hypothetical protein PV08_04252 [Exophiala spinifera]